jgi:methyl-accepting chemotaxis protein
MLFSNTRLGTKLGAAFLTVVLLTLALGTLAVSQMAGIYARTDDIANNWMPSIIALDKIRSSVIQIRRSEADHLLSTDRRELAAIEQRIDAAKQILAQQFAAYEPMIATPEERQWYQDVRTQLDAYLAAQPAMLALSRGDEGMQAQARDAFHGKSGTAINQVAKTLNSLVDLNEAGGRDAADAAKRNYDHARNGMVGLLALVCIAAALLAVAIVRSVTRQLGGEPGSAADLARRVAAGDLSAAIALRSGDDRSMMVQLKRMQDSLSRVVATVRGNAESVAAASAQISQGNADLSQRTEEQASALEETAASMEQLNSTVRQNADNARQANQLAIGASTVAERGGAAVDRVVDTMRGINDSSRRISDIISVIDGIAFQTNILALNAAVEAARAGEQGRGFAVVASEVRSLAQRSAEAAKEIKSLISSSVDQVAQGATLVDEAGSTMREIVESIRRVADIVSEISAASTEQSQGVAQVGEAITQMDRMTQQNAAMVEESAAAAASLKQQAQQLVDTVAVFRLDRDAPALRDTAAAAATAPSATMVPATAPALAAPATAALTRDPAVSAVAARHPAASQDKSPAKPPARPAHAAVARARASAGGGADADWESF